LGAKTGAFRLKSQVEAWANKTEAAMDACKNVFGSRIDLKYKFGHLIDFDGSNMHEVIRPPLRSKARISKS
jgi:hypothetical protein